MRSLFVFLILLIGVIPGRAATGLSTPVLTNFYAPHFIVAPNAPPTQIIKSRIFGPATNIFNLTTNVYNNSYISESNVTQIIDDSTLIITNTTINITNVTFIINGQTNDITQLWRTNAQGIYLPAITNTSTIVVGQSAETWWVPTLADGFVSIHDTSVGDSQFNSLAIAAIDNVLQENYGQFTSTLVSGVAPAGAMQLLAATNWQNPSAPISKFSVDLQPSKGEVLLDLINNGIHDFAVSNQITSVQALQLVPITNVTLALGANQVNVRSNSYIALQSANADPFLTEVQLSTGLRDGMTLLLQNIGTLKGMVLSNASPLYDDTSKFVTLRGGDWVTTNYGEGILLIGGLNGWSEVGRFTQNTNVFSDSLWQSIGGMYLPTLNQTTLWANNIHSYDSLNAQGALRLVPSTNAVLMAGVQPVDVFKKAFVAISATNSDPSLTTVELNMGNFDGNLLVLQNITDGQGFTLQNGSALTDNAGAFVRLNGDWVTTNSGDGLLLVGGTSGWSEVGRFTQNTNVITGAQLWELVSGHMRTVPDTLADWQFRSAGLTNVTIGTNGSLAIGPNTLDFFSTALTDGTALAVARYTDSGEVNAADIEAEVTDSLSETYAGQYTLTARTNSATAVVRAFEGGVEDYEIGSRINRAAAAPMTFNMTEQLTARGLLFSPAVVDGASALAYRFDTVHALTDPASRLVDVKNAGTNQLSFGPDARITFGVGETNVLYRNSSDLVYSNGLSNPYFSVINGAGSVAKFGTSPSGNAQVLADTAKDVQFSVLGTSGNIIYDGSKLTPDVANTKDLGYLNLTWGHVYTTNLIVEGFLNNGIDYSQLSIYCNGSNGPVVLESQGGGIAGQARPIVFSPTISATNGFVNRVKESFSTNYVIGSNTNQQFFLLNGTNQLVTLPPAAGVKDIIYRFSMTNGLGSFVITNAADGAKIRDGISFSYTNIGVNEVGFMSDGSNWWLASKGKQIFPSASWSLGNTISPVQDVITNIPFTQLEFNNSQGIALRTKAGFTGATELAITNAGTYLITFSAVLKGSGGGSVISIWLRKDGVDVPRTRTDQGFTGATAQQCMTVNYFVQVGTTPSYFELCAASHDASPPTIVSAAANPTGYTAPAMPGVIVTINRVSDTWP